MPQIPLDAMALSEPKARFWLSEPKAPMSHPRRCGAWCGGEEAAAGGGGGGGFWGWREAEEEAARELREEGCHEKRFGALQRAEQGMSSNVFAQRFC